MAVMFAVTQGTSAAAPGGHKAVMINGSMRPSVGEDLAQGGGEGVRLARLAVFAAEESVMAAGEGDGRCPEPFGHGRAARPAIILADCAPTPTMMRVDAERSAPKSCW